MPHSLSPRPMNWDMEIGKIEAVLEKIWDLHDKISDAIHSVIRTHFLDSIKPLNTSDTNRNQQPRNDDDEAPTAGFVFVKDSHGAVDVDASAISEAKSLNAIRTALENLEEQLDFFYTVQIQQRAERDAAIARLEQSRILLAVRLEKHHGKKYSVIEEALAFIGYAHDTGLFVSPDHRYSLASSSGQNFMTHHGKRSNTCMRFVSSSFDFVKDSLRITHMGGKLCNAALIAVSMLTLLHMRQIGHRDKIIIEQPLQWGDFFYGNRALKRSSPLVSDRWSRLDVLLARG